MLVLNTWRGAGRLCPQFYSRRRQGRVGNYGCVGHWRIQELKLGGISLTPPSSSPSLFLLPSLSYLPSISLSLSFFSFSLPPSFIPHLALSPSLPHSPAKESGGALWAPPAGSGRSPSRKRIFDHFDSWKQHIVSVLLTIYLLKAHIKSKNKQKHEQSIDLD